jgi:GT2 family glycosyltransferase
LTRLAVVLVHYRTPELVRPAIEALVEDAAGSALDLEIRLVDNGSDGADRELWRDLPLAVVEGTGNRGYASGTNAGMEATTAPWALIMNPDVVVQRGCLAALVGALDDGADAAGPLFSWDRAGRILLPPTEERSLAAELLAQLARRSNGLAAVARRRWRRHARRHWEARAPIDSPSLSGALLALRREAWHRVGPFDEGYRLYFEETDWLLRLVSAGGRSRLVPAARAAHWHAQSSFREPRSEAWFGDSERRFRRTRYGALANSVLAGLRPQRPRDDSFARQHAVAAGDAPPRLEAKRLGLDAAGGWIEMSPLERGFPATGERIAAGIASWALDGDLWRRSGTPALFVRGVDAAGRESDAQLYPAAASAGGGA